jgi:uncharacterized protein (TIGR02996 family)
MSAAYEDDPFIRAMLADPDNDAPRLIYADWLEECGDPRGEYLRLECHLATLSQDDPQLDPLLIHFRELHRQIDPGWRAAVARSKVERCRLFEFRCPKRWDKLRPTKDSAVRVCTACRKEVFYCESILEARQHGERGRCVAIDVAVPRHEGDLEDEEHLGSIVVGLMDFDDSCELSFDLPQPPTAAPKKRRPWWRFW